MPQIAVLLINLAFLALLWLFVLAAIRTVRLDIFGPRVPRAARPSRKEARAAAPPPAAKLQKGKVPRELLVVEGALKGTRVKLNGSQITIGRDEASTLVLTDDYVSNHHARIFASAPDRWLVEDLGSTNGTYLGQAKVTNPTPLTVGSKVRVGRTVMELRK
jgi:pSer/pThr/pTyr-binding forkhead associated (FHA) protein